MKQIILIKNDKLKQSAFAIDYCFYLYENIIKEVDFNTIESLILKKEKKRYQKNLFKMKEKKDLAKGSKAATGEPAAKVEIDPKIKD